MVQTGTQEPSQKLASHIVARPDIWEKIQVVFPEDPINAGEIIARESSFNPSIYNVMSNACGLGQAYPCDKQPCEIVDTPQAADCQLQWIREYVNNRYGDFNEAVAFHNLNGWY